MIKWWQKHKSRRQARELVKGTRKILRMQRDILDPRDVQAVGDAANALDGALSAKNAGVVPGLADRLEHQLGRVFPREKFASLRENVEVFLVAAIVAMGVRTFFFQPFKIPTGSMQPTLYGMVVADNCDRYGSIVTRITRGLCGGTWPQRPDDNMVGSLQKFFNWALFSQWPVNSVCLFSGDHIFVDRFTYHFRRPQRGEVIVFDTSDIQLLPESSRGKFYIKRLIGLGGDKIQIQPPVVKVNGQVLDERAAFKRIYSRQNGYNGYVLPQPGYPAGTVVRSALDIYAVPDKHLFVLGDNSVSSLDGRYWGSLPEQALVGRAVMVYWPFTKRFGLVD